MKVLEVVNLNPNKLGSFEKYCLGNGEFLRSKGHEHMAFFKGDACPVLQHELDAVGSTFKNRFFGKLGLIDAFSLMRYIQKNNIDVVHFHFYPAFNVFSFISQFMHCKVFYSYRISGEFSDNNFWVTALKMLRSKCLGIGVNAVFCVSAFARKKFIHNYLADPDKVLVVHNGLHWGYFASKEAEIKKPQGKFSVICVAALIPDKGVVDLINATAQIVDKIPTVHLTLVGDGSGRAELEALVKTTELEAHVSFLGSRDDVPDLLYASDVAVVPSRWGEAFGFTVIEAMAAGLPVIASSVGGIPEIIDPDKTGILVNKEAPEEIAASLLRLYENEQLRTELGKQARQRVKDYFNVSRVHQEQLEHYLKL